jgi:hypothetical protein
MHLRKTTILSALAALSIFSFHASAQSPDPFGGKLFPPDSILEFAYALKLSPEQREAIREIVERAQPRFDELQKQLKTEVEALGKMAEPTIADQAVILPQFNKVADLERDIKRTQLSMLLDLRSKLTEDQRTTLTGIRAKMNQELMPRLADGRRQGEEVVAMLAEGLQRLEERGKTNNDPDFQRQLAEARVRHAVVQAKNAEAQRTFAVAEATHAESQKQIAESQARRAESQKVFQELKIKSARMSAGLERWRNEGRDIKDIVPLMLLLGPLTRESKHQESIVVLDQILAILEDGK